jgi:hypothetical protein
MNDLPALIWAANLADLNYILFASGAGKDSSAGNSATGSIVDSGI